MKRLYISMYNRKFIPVANPFIDSKEINAVNYVMRKKWITMGKKVQQFENSLAKFLGVKYVVAMNNGTSTLDSLVKYFSINNKEQEVIIPDLTYISTANVVTYNNGKIVLCDSNNDNFNINLKDLEKKISTKTKLIIVTDMKGMPVDYDELLKIANKKKIPVIADSAEALGSVYKNRKVGSQVFAHSFSFFANKNITTGEGGAISTNNKKLYKFLLKMRNQGQSKRYHHVIIGNNYRMTDIAATIGIEQLKKLKVIINKKNKIANFYNKKFNDRNEITLPEIPKYVSQHSWYNYTIIVNSKKRDKLINFLKKNKIETRVSFPTISSQPIYKNLYYNRKKSNSIRLTKSLIDLPIWTMLSVKDQKKVIKAISVFFDDKY